MVVVGFAPVAPPVPELQAAPTATVRTSTKTVRSALFGDPGVMAAKLEKDRSTWSRRLVIAG
jgi:hypothetical protein